MMQNFKVGDVVPLDYARRPFGAETDPTWYIVTRPPSRNLVAQAWLKRVGAIDVWTPTEKVWRIVRGKRDRVEAEKLIAPSYLFVMVEREPVWDVLFAQGRGRISGVVGVGGKPYKVPLDVMAEMAQMPERIMQARADEAAAAYAKRMAKMPKPGGKARLTQGPLAGRVVDISQIDAGIAHFIAGGFSGSAKADTLEHVDDNARDAI